MDSIFFLIAVLVYVAIIGGVVYGVYVWRVRRSGRYPEPEPDTGIGTPRRFYFYSISFVALMMISAGLMTVLAELLDALFGSVLRGSTTRLATGLAVTIVGLPLWYLHWRFVRRSVASTPSERRSILRKLYLYVTLGVALGFLVFSGYHVLEFILRARDFSPLDWAALPVWGAVWYFHWRIATGETPETTLETRAIRRLYLYLASSVTVVMLGSGIGWIIYIVLREGYLAAFGVSMIDAGPIGLSGDAFRTAISLSIVAAGAWVAHWVVFARSDGASALRWAHLFLTSIGFGAIPAMMGLGMVMHVTLAWLLGTSADSAADHFETLPEAVAVLSVGLAMWAYFRYLITSESSAAGPSSTGEGDQAGDESTVVSRSYDVLLAAIGLLTLSIGVASVLEAAIAQLSDTAPVVIGQYSFLLSRLDVALPFLLIGAPIWWIHWRRLEAAASADPEVERPMLPRKLYVLGVLCLGLLALVGGASATLFIFLRDLLDLSLSSDTLYEMRGGLSVVLTTLWIIPYHWSAYRHDREFEPDAPDPLAGPMPKSVLLLTAPGGSEMVAQVESALGYTVTRVHWLDLDAFVPTLDADQIDRLAEEIASAPGTSVILVPGAHGLRVISYR